MNKTELIEAVANEAELTKAAAARAVDAVFNQIKASLQAGDPVTLIGFGTFDTSVRKARTGRNPQTGKEIKIKEAIVPKFRPGKGLKDAVNTK